MIKVIVMIKTESVVDGNEDTHDGDDNGGSKYKLLLIVTAFN